MRIDKDAVRRVAREFVHGHGRAWHWVGSSVQDALVDAAVMEHIRAAHSADAESPVTPAEICEFRAALARALADGVPMGSSGRQHFVTSAEHDAATARAKETK